MNQIFDKLEIGLNKTPFKKILDGVYSGQTCQQIMCSECNYISSRDDKFFNLSIVVKGVKTIDESLEKFIREDYIDEYKCEQCNKKVKGIKSVCLKSLPNVLIIHMQRLIFNLDTLMNEKINTRLEFS